MSRGPAPKPPGTRSRARNEGQTFRVVDVVAVPQPLLPEDVLPDGEQWSPATRRWWSAWGESPLTEGWDAVVWGELLVAALLHHRAVTTGSSAAATELRLRVAKLGATPDDRARLRIVTADADRRDEQQAKANPGADARTRYGRPQVVRTPTDPDLERTPDDDDDHDAPRDAG